MLTFSRKPAAIIVACVLGAASVRATAEGDERPENGTPKPNASSAASAAPVVDLADVLKRKQSLPPNESKDDWPTDDFGRPLRSCDVPWDFVPKQ